MTTPTPTEPTQEQRINHRRDEKWQAIRRDLIPILSLGIDDRNHIADAIYNAIARAIPPAIPEPGQRGKACERCRYSAWVTGAETGKVLYCAVCNAHDLARAFKTERDEARAQIADRANALRRNAESHESLAHFIECEPPTMEATASSRPFTATTPAPAIVTVTLNREMARRWVDDREVSPGVRMRDGEASDAVRAAIVVAIAEAEKGADNGG